VAAPTATPNKASSLKKKFGLTDAEINLPKNIFPDATGSLGGWTPPTSENSKRTLAPSQASVLFLSFKSLKAKRICQPP
jgi:hypothetical protein